MIKIKWNTNDKLRQKINARLGKMYKIIFDNEIMFNKTQF